MHSIAHSTHCSGGEGEDARAMEKMSAMFGPGQIDQVVRQANQFCWMALPPDRQNVDEVERQIRRLVERALQDLREDSEAFRGKP